MSNKNTDVKIETAPSDLKDFQKKVLDRYLDGTADSAVEADGLLARSNIPPMTAYQRSFASLAFEYPQYNASNCVACLDCVVQCPDAAIMARVTPEGQADKALSDVQDGETKAALKARFVRTTKYWDVPQKKGKTPADYSIWIDPDKCKGCGECANVCGDHNALTMVRKDKISMAHERAGIQFIKKTLPPTPKDYINDKLPSDLFLMDDTWVYRGGAGACKGCGEITALKMALGTTSAKYGKNMVIVAATGCNSVFSSTYPYNIYDVPWTNSLFENAPTTAIGARMRLNQNGKQDTKLWVLGGDGAMSDIGFQSLSRAVVTGEDINVLVMDTQVYSNTGGQASSSTYTGQNAKMSAAGRAAFGKTERRKELGLIMMSHPDVYVAQVSPAYHNHFIKAVLGALEYKGPSVIIAYSPCLPEHGVADHLSYERAKAAVMSRAFPLFVHDPRAGSSLKQRLSLMGNPSVTESWHKDPKTGEVFDFSWFARAEDRFAKLFGKDGTPSELMLKSQDDRLKNWDLLRELAGAK